ncbi:MAG: ABC transporter permease [Candidatus Kerfeldbacteria bacterium]|nr:ABC transporter permease [Candidatus Kerfeldbacteria bacterium]
MMVHVHILTALRQLTINKGRSLLTMLGIIIGIGSVIFIITVGEVAKNFLISQISQFGTNVLEISPTGELGPVSGDGGVVVRTSTLQALEDSPLLPDLEALSGWYGAQGTLEYNGEQEGVSAFGVEKEAFSINNFTPVAGRVLSDADVLQESRVVVIGTQLAEKLFDSAQNAVHKEVKINSVRFEIVGVLEDVPLGGGFLGETVYVPLSTVYREFAPSEDVGTVSVILIQFAQGTNVASFKERIKVELKRLLYLSDEEIDSAFFMADRASFLDIFNTILIGIQAFVSAVAGISLVVGGIGIMNIMLVTVKERTKEIGLRKAIGANNSSVRTQFLIEAIILTTIGGLIGVAGGLTLSFFAVVIANVLQPDWGITFVFVPQAILIACGVAGFVGLVFGLYPAFKASRLSPIEALRYE